MSEEVKIKFRRWWHMRIIVPTLIFVAVLGLWYFKRPEIPEEIHKALNPPVAENKPDAQTQVIPAPSLIAPEQVPQAETTPAPQIKNSEEKVKGDRSATKRVLGKVIGIMHQDGKVNKGNGEWEISDHPPSLRPIPSSESLLAGRAEKKKRDEERARVAAVRDIQEASDLYFKILNDGGGR